MTKFYENSTEALLLSRLNIAGHIISHHTESTSSQRRLLSLISSHENATQIELASLMGITPPSLSALASKLEAKGYIQRTEDSTDRRGKKVSITSEGLGALKSMNEEHTRSMEGLFSALTEAERLQAIELLDKLLISWEPEHRKLKKKFDEHEKNHNSNI